MQKVTLIEAGFIDHERYASGHTPASCVQGCSKQSETVFGGITAVVCGF